VKTKRPDAIFSDYQSAAIERFSERLCLSIVFLWIKSHGQPGQKQPISNTEMILVWKHKKAKTSGLVFNPQYQPGAAYRKFYKGGNPTRKKHSDYLTENLNGDRFPIQTLYYPSKDNLPESERLPGFPCQKSIGLIGYLINSLSKPRSDL
jgi:hypothetical protein